MSISVGKYGALGKDSVRVLGNYFNIAHCHFQHARELNKQCKRCRNQEAGAHYGRLLAPAEKKKDEACSCGHKIRLSQQDCEVIAACAGIAGSDVVREVRHRFAKWRSDFRGRGGEAGDGGGTRRGAAAAAAATHITSDMDDDEEGLEDFLLPAHRGK